MRKDGEGKGTGGPGLQCLVGRPNTPSRSGVTESLEAPHKSDARGQTSRRWQSTSQVEVHQTLLNVSQSKSKRLFVPLLLVVKCVGSGKKLLDRSIWLTRRGEMEQNATNKRFYRF